MASAALIPTVTSLFSAYSAVQAGKTPKLPAVKELADPESLVKKRKDQREAQKKYGETGRAGTVLSGSSSLG